ncbi:hypothetical protein P22_1982 [Propionispora sp. 2/2-37]|uniref:VRR-NUC domain-containing protein n=1 Tax=Propionispora sp. 2/2-37 TaxID=1677858 RepID=UPI0006BB6039|nr:VRR-NUC domain-containing protein [Propionispora sp. 2/2-37]CUH95896.1 hypothetical protein P22_1982 [Propionispora sp. 2/2-37]
MLEKQIEKKFKNKIEAAGGLCLKFVSPGFAGVPDRIILKPGGEMYFAEIKKPGERLRPLQEKRKKQLEALGFMVEVIDYEDV